MDGSSVEHSDSDSGESWTMLEGSPADRSPTHADNAPDFPDSPVRRIGESAEHSERDDDTDGISIISESESEAANNYEMVQSVIEVPGAEEPPADANIALDYFERNEHANSTTVNQEPIKDPDDVLGDGAGRLKTYVHRRNQRLSTVLNILMLGSVITAAGVAIGHMWGVRDDCSLQATQSVNKILSNLYKLQEENAYLRSKLKELTLINNIQMQQRKNLAEQRLLPKQRCKKVFEESLTNKNVGRATKCVDFDSANSFNVDAHLVQPAFEKEFISDVNKLKHVYQQNKSWLDVEVARRLENEGIALKAFKDKKVNKTRPRGKSLKDASLKEQLDITVDSEPAYVQVSDKLEDVKKTYAESLMSNNDAGKRRKRSIQESGVKEWPKRKRMKKLNETLPSDSDEEFTKDDRYVGHKHARDTKRDRQKSHRREKRRNKYQQWEMKGGYIKDYDDISVKSQDLGRPEPEKKRKEGKMRKEKAVETDAAWADARAGMRRDARRKLEMELFHIPNSASWYFRRMKRREQCRFSKGGNATNRPNVKTDMNFKTKR